MTDISPTGILAIALFGPGAIAVAYIAKNAIRRRLPDIWNLTFRRSRTCRADMHTNAGRVITRYVVPDGRGLFRHRDGVYHFPKEAPEIDPLYSVPCADFLEMQIPAELGDLVVDDTNMLEVPVKKKAPDGTLKNEVVKVPQFMLNHAGIRPKLIPLARRDEKTGKVKVLDEPPVTSVEMADALDSKIVRDVTQASIADLQMNRVFIVCLIILGVLVLGLFAVYGAAQHAQSTAQSAVDSIRQLKG